MKFYLANRVKQMERRTVEEVVTELVDSKVRSGRSKYTIEELRCRLTRFSDECEAKGDCRPDHRKQVDEVRYQL